MYSWRGRGLTRYETKQSLNRNLGWKHDGGGGYVNSIYDGATGKVWAKMINGERCRDCPGSGVKIRKKRSQKDGVGHAHHSRAERNEGKRRQRRLS